VGLAARLAVAFPHELLVEMFRTRGELAPALLQLCSDLELAHDRVEQRSIDLSQVVSTEYRADAVVVLRAADDTAVAAVIVEVQLRIDHDKEESWPVYVTALRAKLGCRVVLLVVVPSAQVASWARTPIETGHPGFTLTPVVMELPLVPRITDPVEAERLPELGVLSTMANPDLEVATAALHAISALPEDQKRLYLDVIMAALSPSLRAALEHYMEGHVYQSDFARKYYSQGLEEGRQEGREQGLEEGNARGLRKAVLELVHAKLDGVTAEEQAAIDAMGNERVLTELIGALARAASPGEARAVLATARSR
jgi:hypothetical protein